MLDRLFSLFRSKRKYKNLQEYFFTTALEEVRLPNEKFEIDHYHGRCWSPETDWIPLVFPEKIIGYVDQLSKEKTQDYFFRGFVSSNRDWLNRYPGFESSEYGRNKETKYQIDENYYRTLSATRFGLAPIGDCPWSYRFFEAVMCHSLPVLGKDDQDIFAEEYSYLRDGEDHNYDADVCAENYQTFLKNHSLRHLR